MLGIVLAPQGQYGNGGWPYETVGSRANRQSILCPDDPMYFTKADAGYYHDTSLGALPTDVELSTNRGYMAVASGWIATTAGPLQPSWNPPDNRARPQLPQVQLVTAGLGNTRYSRNRNARMLHDAAAPPDANAADVAAIYAASSSLAEQQKHNDRMFVLSLFSTAAITVSALVAIFRATHKG